MNKKIYGFLLFTLVLAIFIMPTAVFANTENCIDLSTATTNLSGEGWDWNNSTNTLALTNAELIGDGTGDAIKFNPSKDVTIILNGKNSISSFSRGIVRSSEVTSDVGSLTISGTGTLDINDMTYGFDVPRLIVNGVTLNIEVVDGGIISLHTLTIENDANVDIEITSEDVNAYGPIYINGNLTLLNSILSTNSNNVYDAINMAEEDGDSIIENSTYTNNGKTWALWSTGNNLNIKNSNININGAYGILETGGNINVSNNSSIKSQSTANIQLLRTTTGKINNDMTNEILGISREDTKIIYFNDYTLENALTIGVGQTLEILSDVNLTINGGVTLSNKGNIINNGTITNNGNLYNYDNAITTNNGTINNNNEFRVIDGNLDFTNGDIIAKYNNENYDIYWDNNSLSLKNVLVTGDILLPTQNVNIIIDGSLLLNGNIIVQNGNSSNLTLNGGTLKVDGGIDAGNGSLILDSINVNANNINASNVDSKLILKNQSYLNVINGISIGASGATTGEIILLGASLIESAGDYSQISTGKFTIEDKDSKIKVSVSDGLAVSSGNSDAFNDVNISSNGKIGIVFTDTTSIIDNDNNALKEVELTVKTYKINAVSGENGTISNLGISEIIRNNNLTYNISPNEGYKIKDVLIDGISKGIINEYTFKNVSDNHTIEVSFEKEESKVSVQEDSNGKVVDEVKEDNPQTSDGVLFYVVLGLISLVGFSVNILYIKKRFN